MNEKTIHNGDVVTFIALKWKEGLSKPKYPVVLLAPVAQVYEDGFDFETVINEALVDANIDGKLSDAGSKKFLSERGRNLKYLKHIAQEVAKGKEVPDRNYTVLRETYQFWRDENGKFQCKNLSH